MGNKGVTGGNGKSRSGVLSLSQGKRLILKGWLGGAAGRSGGHIMTDFRPRLESAVARQMVTFDRGFLYSSKTAFEGFFRGRPALKDSGRARGGALQTSPTREAGRRGGPAARGETCIGARHFR
jgi:hypothetical protein